MILFILLTVLAVGIICFLVGQYWEQQKDKRLIQRPIDVDDDPEPKYNRIKRDLDQLLLLYEQEVISEEKTSIGIEAFAPDRS